VLGGVSVAVGGLAAYLRQLSIPAVLPRSAILRIVGCDDWPAEQNEFELTVRF
jgi:hypothetical protein